MRVSMKEIWHNLDHPLKNKELWSYVVKFEFSRPKSSSILVKNLPYLVLITKYCVHRIFLVSHMIKKAGNMINWRQFAGKQCLSLHHAGRDILPAVLRRFIGGE